MHKSTIYLRQKLKKNEIKKKCFKRTTLFISFFPSICIITRMSSNEMLSLSGVLLSFNFKINWILMVLRVRKDSQIFNICWSRSCRLSKIFQINFQRCVAENYYSILLCLIRWQKWHRQSGWWIFKRWHQTLERNVLVIKQTPKTHFASELS